MITVELVDVVLDAMAPDVLGRFWAHALGWTTREAGGGGVELVPTDATSFRVLLRSARTEKVGQNRIHLDLTTTTLDDQRDTVDALLALGGRHVDIGQDPADSHVVLADPEGNELCVIGPDDRFLASCPRLGAVNCDGTRALGHFFSAALGWSLVWDQDEETAIQAPEGTGPKITCSGPPLMPVLGEPRFHLHLAPAAGTGAAVALEHLRALGASRRDVGPGCPGAILLADVDGNPLCLVERELAAGQREVRDAAR